MVLFGLLAGVAAVGWVALRADPEEVRESAVTNRPVQEDGNGYVTSVACRTCHPDQYDAWRASYHRTMTTVATPETVIPGFDGVEVTGSDGHYHLTRQGRDVWAEMDDPDWDGRGEAPRIRRPIVLVTGSHHQQVFWYATEQGRLLGQLPITYLVSEKQWVPRGAAFLQPPLGRAISETGHWNAICIGCHTTNGQPRLNEPLGTVPLVESSADSRVTEFGIACEACHGPAAEHVRLNRSPWRRYSFHLSGRPDPSLVQPERLDAKASSQVCGQCHSVWEFLDGDVERLENRAGVQYTPGGELEEWRFIAQPTRNMQSARMQELLAADPRFVSDAFWPDGMVSVSGREYNGLIDSPCYVRGSGQRDTMTCLSCHKMHQEAGDSRPTPVWAADQLGEGMDGNEACLQCHAPLRPRLQAHTHHRPESLGSSCYNCHMPHTTYGLLKAIRSHQITSPDVRTSVSTGRPDSCSLCHLDKTLEWTAEYLEAWYGTPRPELTGDENSVAASLLWLLRGDAQQRAIVAYAFGWDAAQQTSDTGWMAPFLARLLEDPYPAVRFIAGRSLRSLPGFEHLDYDYVGTRDRWADARREAEQAWRRSRVPTAAPTLLDADGSVRADIVDRLMRERDNRIVFLRE